MPAAPVDNPAPARGDGSSAGAVAASAGGVATSTNGARPTRGASARERWLSHVDAWLPTLLIAAVLCFVAFVAGGGLNLSDMTTVEISLTLGAGLIAATAVLLGPGGMRAYGAWPLALLLAFTALTALSVAWSVQPDDSFKDAGRMLAYCAVFGACIVLARTLPARWPAVLGGIVLAAVVVCGYALLTKVFPAQLDSSDIYSRLRAPYSYWNAIGLTAAMGVIACMWLGARRAGHALLSALAYPAMGLMLLTLMLAYSRGALVALVLGLALWFCIVPLRLRGAAILISSAVLAGAVVAWDFSRHALSTDNVELAARSSAGHRLGALIVVMLVLLTFAGLAFGFWTGRAAPSLISRRRAGALLLALLAVVVLAGAGALAASHRGFTGSISHGVHALTDPHAAVPSNAPGRLTAVGSVRARYWNEALKVFKAHPWLGAGAEGYATARLRYRTETLDVRHAHGYGVQTLADLGIIGLALTLGLLLVWMAAAGRATHPFNRRWTDWATLRAWLARHGGGYPAWRRLTVQGRAAPYSAERVGLLSMLCLVVVFGIHSLADWTWYVPGNACVALLCAGWLAGRGPLGAGAGEAALVAAELPAGAGAAPPDHGAGSSSGVGPDSAAAPTPDGETTLNVRPARARVPSVGELRARLSPSALGPLRTGVAVAIVIGALLAAWAQWQPQRSADASQQALSQLASNPRAAVSSAQAAVSRDPLSAQALFTLSAVQQNRREPALARATLQRAVRLQPSNPQTWLTLGEYDLASNDASSALHEIEAAIYLNPESINAEAIAQGNPEAIAIQNAYAQASRAVDTQRIAAAAAAAAKQRALRTHKRRATHRVKVRRAGATKP
ncbi:MAG TPA: O-antigen ligase family protein [Solirubrobacteraceae bacterium]|nr:O-antigen ligase family protein [Solirubrobacteraceae bacterium]